MAAVVDPVSKTPVEAEATPEPLSDRGLELVEAVEAEDWPRAERLLAERPSECDVNAWPAFEPVSGLSKGSHLRGACPLRCSQRGFQN